MSNVYLDKPPVMQHEYFTPNHSSGFVTTLVPNRKTSRFHRRQLIILLILFGLVSSSAFFFTVSIFPKYNGPIKTTSWTLKASKTCSRSIIGKDLVTDEHGYTCSWKDSWMQPSGCCDANSEFSSRFSCDSCDAQIGCCGIYEICVSCCLKEDNLKTHFQSDRMKALASKDRELVSMMRDPFELCKSVCRTSSQSVYLVDGDTVFRSENLKYCYASSQSSTQTSGNIDNLSKDVQNIGRRTNSIQNTGSASSMGPIMVIYHICIILISFLVLYM